MAAMESIGNLGLFYRDFASPAVWHKVKNLKSIQGPGAETAFNDATDFDSPGGRREFRPGLIDPGSLEMTANYKPGDASAAFLKQAQTDRKLVTFQLITHDADTGDREVEQFTAYVQTKSRSAEVDGFMEMTLGLRITGDSLTNVSAYPTIALVASPDTVIEGGSPASATFTATLSRPDIKDTEISVSWGGSAANPAEYTRPAETTYTIPAGETSVAIGPVTVASIATNETVDLTIVAEIDGEALTGTLTDTLNLTAA